MAGPPRDLRLPDDDPHGDRDHHQPTPKHGHDNVRGPRDRAHGRADGHGNAATSSSHNNNKRGSTSVHSFSDHNRPGCWHNQHQRRHNGLEHNIYNRRRRQHHDRRRRRRRRHCRRWQQQQQQQHQHQHFGREPSGQHDHHTGDRLSEHWSTAGTNNICGVHHARWRLRLHGRAERALVPAAGGHGERRAVLQGHGSGLLHLLRPRLRCQVAWLSSVDCRQRRAERQPLRGPRWGWGVQLPGAGGLQRSC
mmetsp:Transcript_24650/g.70977  ORF Transcript_24650/g.70977 Transcript_24650/m.70977 type:complete len:250 (-) Transcript_24650:666-1415(-)